MLSLLQAFTLQQHNMHWIPKLLRRWLTARSSQPLPSAVEGMTTQSMLLAKEDAALADRSPHQRFSMGSRPVIRWIKGDGLDDDVTRAAIGQATRLFGTDVDYCLCTYGIDAHRARRIMEWSVQPVEWRPVDADDNRMLARYLTDAGCAPEHFGYWWKWFPERVRPGAPEWILDGDMVITGKPSWYADWLEGKDQLRVTQDDRELPERMYGRYVGAVDLQLRLYSGLISLPPELSYMPHMEEVFRQEPLLAGHHGQRDMCEQGVIAATFQRMNPTPIPLYEFPFARAFEENIDYGLQGDLGREWGFHFGHSFRMYNPHFNKLTDEGIIFSRDEPSLRDRFLWLGGTGQWGIPGWSITDHCLAAILAAASAFKGRPVLELGTSRGRSSASLAWTGCRLTTVDHMDRGAASNLEGMGVRVVQDDAIRFLQRAEGEYDLVICDLHGNSEQEWRKLSQPILGALKPKGVLLISNLRLHQDAAWKDENGVEWFLGRLPEHCQVEVIEPLHPGVVKITLP
jgi:predicted O-methyltransferase YrrM